MFDQVFDNVRKATETSLQMQQDLFRQWTGCWPGFAKPQVPWPEQVQKFQKEWPQMMTEMMGKYRESIERQYKAGLKSLEEAFHVSEAKDPEELRKKTQELWRKTFECLHELAEAQVRDFEMAVEKWAEFAKKMAS
jgi:hypothetical protein